MCPDFVIALYYIVLYMWASLVTQWYKSPCQGRRCRRHSFDPWVGKIPWRRKW